MRWLLSLLLLAITASVRADEPAWVAPMKQVHAKFTGKPGTFAQFGDSITVTMAYWAGLRYEHKNLDAPGQKAFELVNSYILRDEAPDNNAINALAGQLAAFAWDGIRPDRRY